MRYLQYIYQNLFFISIESLLPVFVCKQLNRLYLTRLDKKHNKIQIHECNLKKLIQIQRLLPLFSQFRYHLFHIFIIQFIQQ